MASLSSTFKPLSAADSCLLSHPSLFTSTPTHKSLSFSFKPLKPLHISTPLAVNSKPRFLSANPFVAQTSNWAQQEEEDNNTTLTMSDEEGGEQSWSNEGSDEMEAAWEGEGVGGEGESEEVESEEGEGFDEPPEDAKIFVGNLPYDVDSQKLAELFEQAGTVEIAEVIYNRETDTSRGFGFVTMSTVEEADKAVEMLHRYDLQGRFLTVNKAAPRGAKPERTPLVFESGNRIYVGNLPWSVDDARLEQVFSEYGKVVEARVVYDRDSGRSRGFGFVAMSTETEVNDAIAALDGQSLDGRAIRVNVAEERPRRRFF